MRTHENLNEERVKGERLLSVLCLVVVLSIT